MDITRFMEVVNNIIDNAIKYTYIDDKKEKKIKIETMRNVIYDRSNDRSIWTIETDENREIDNKVRYIVISIGDNGIGIENSRLEGIFRPFYRKRMAMDVNGTGLKMYFCKKHMDKFEGFITINSVEHVGTIVKIYIPQIRGEKEEGEAIS